MRIPNLSELVRASGHEVLFLLAEASTLMVNPTMRNAEHLQRVYAELRERRGVEAMRERGLLESAAKAKDALRLTKLGQIVLAGGRDPEEAWARSWDGQWRLLSFDLPRQQGNARVQFWRWLRANHFGKLQGSLWITPDPVPALETITAKAGFDPSAVLVFTGAAEGALTTHEMVAKAWDYSVINASYERYQTFAEATLGAIRGKRTPLERLRRTLDEDRTLWQKALRPDPLLPKTLSPRRYAGPRACKLRAKLHKTLFRSLDLPAES